MFWKVVKILECATEDNATKLLKGKKITAQSTYDLMTQGQQRKGSSSGFANPHVPL